MKFDTNIAEELYALTADQEIGTVQDAGWFGLFLMEKIILVEDNQGFVTTWSYPTIKATGAEWDSLEKQYGEFYASLDDSNGGQF
jgi:hypothetical protein